MLDAEYKSLLLLLLLLLLQNRMGVWNDTK